MACTIVNSAIAALAVAVVATALVIAGQWVYAVPAAVATAVLSASAIYFKGYLVPGTPSLTKRYFPPWLLRKFGKAHATVTRSREQNEQERDEPEEEFNVDMEDALLEANAVEECRSGTDLCLTEEFRSAWFDEIDRIKNDDDVGRDRLLDVLDAEAEVDVEFEDHGDAFRADAEGRHLGSWESRGAFVADVAAGQLLPDRIPEWHVAKAYERGNLLQGLRLFLETCPMCGEDLSFGTETVESCCSTQDVAAVTCDGCGERLFESPVDGPGGRVQG